MQENMRDLNMQIRTLQVLRLFSKCVALLVAGYVAVWLRMLQCGRCRCADPCFARVCVAMFVAGCITVRGDDDRSVFVAVYCGVGDLNPQILTL